MEPHGRKPRPHPPSIRKNSTSAYKPKLGPEYNTNSGKYCQRVIVENRHESRQAPTGRRAKPNFWKTLHWRRTVTVSGRTGITPTMEPECRFPTIAFNKRVARQAALGLGYLR